MADFTTSLAIKTYKLMPLIRVEENRKTKVQSAYVSIKIKPPSKNIRFCKRFSPALDSNMAADCPSKSHIQLLFSVVDLLNDIQKGKLVQCVRWKNWKGTQDVSKKLSTGNPANSEKY